MKKLLLMLSFALLSVISYGQKTIDIKNEGEGPKVQITFGRESMDCRNIGICKFKVEITWDDVVNLFTAIVSKQGKLKIVFDKATFEQNKSSFQKNAIVLEEDFTLDRETSKAIGFANGYTIKKGVYAITLDPKTNTYNCTF